MSDDPIVQSLVGAAEKGEQAAFDALAARNPEQETVKGALNALLYRKKGDKTEIGAHYIVALLERLEGISAGGPYVALVSKGRDDVLRARLESTGSPLRQAEKDLIFTMANVHRKDAIFDAFAPHVAQSIRDDMFRTGVSLLQEEGADAPASPRMRDALLDAGITPGVLVESAINGTGGGIESAAVILRHPSFPRERVNEVLTGIGDKKGNAEAVAAALEIGGSKAIADFYAAAARKEKKTVMDLAPSMPDEVVRRVVEMNAAQANGKIAESLIRKFPGKLDLEEVFARAVGHSKRNGILKAVIARGGREAREDDFRIAVNHGDGKGLEILLTAKNAAAAAAKYLDGDDAKNGPRHSDDAEVRSMSEQRRPIREKNLSLLRARTGG